ncbi:MAG: T9SS type A sorting domain-containing protein [Calditrichota bacterium]
MKPLSLVLLFSLLSVSLSFSQPPDTLWMRTYYADMGGNANALCLTQDGGYAVAGICCFHGYHNFFFGGFVKKLDHFGQTEWTWGALGGTLANSCWANDVISTADGGVVACGSGDFWGGGYGGGPDMYLWVARLNAQGDTLWFYEQMDNLYWYGGGRAIATATDGFLIAGSNSASLTKLDTAGHLLWQRDWGMTLEDITATPDGNFVCVGSYDTSASRCLIVKVTPDGDTLWTRDCNTVWDEQVHAVTSTFGGGLAICGTGNFPLGVDTFLGILDSSGNYLVRRAYEHEHSYAIDLCQLADSGFILVGGITPTYPNPRQTFVVRTAPNADAMWIKLWDEPFENFANSVLQDTDSGFVLVGKWGNDYWYISKLEYDLVDIDESPTARLPESFSLSAYPNPFNPSTTISFSLPKSAITRLKVYDLMGREVVVLTDGMLEAGEHRIAFDGSNSPSGLYFARLQSGDFITTQKLLLVK